jgi:hypothetical protein
MTSSTLKLSAPSLLSAFQFLVVNKPTTSVISDIFSEDLDGDGVQEIIFTGRQGNSPIIQWSNSTVHIFKAQKSVWSEVTSSWLPDNVIVGSEPNVLFGDLEGLLPLDTSSLASCALALAI